jgi:hypothetical protein
MKFFIFNLDFNLSQPPPPPLKRRGCGNPPPTHVHQSRISKRLRSPGIESEEAIPPAYVAWRGGTSNRVVITARKAGNRFLGSLKGLQIRALPLYVGGIRKKIYKDDFAFGLLVPSSVTSYRRSGGEPSPYL